MSRARATATRVDALLAALLVALCLSGCGERTAPATPVSSDSPQQVIAVGRVEPAGEERLLIPESQGRVARVLIEEGDAVRQGQLLAELDNALERAAVAAAQAGLDRAQAVQARLSAGARAEELTESAAALTEARAAARQAQADAKRRERLAADGVLAGEARDQARTAAALAAARETAAAARDALLRAGARSEDLAIVAADLAAAKARLDQAQAQLAKTLIFSPINGTVLRRDLREGETVVALSPLPLARLGDLSQRWVRAEIDEFDLRDLRVGAPVTVSTNAFPGQQFTGEVVRVGRRMGRRQTLSDRPTERVDSQVLEVMIRLDGDPELPIGLRVDVRIAVNASD